MHHPEGDQTLVATFLNSVASHATRRAMAVAMLLGSRVLPPASDPAAAPLAPNTAASTMAGSLSGSVPGPLAAGVVAGAGPWGPGDDVPAWPTAWPASVVAAGLAGPAGVGGLAWQAAELVDRVLWHNLDLAFCRNVMVLVACRCGQVGVCGVQGGVL